MSQIQIGGHAMSRSIGLRTLVPLLAASALLLASAGGVLAKCEHDPDACEGVSATFDPGGTLSAGGSETVGVWILEDEQPYAASRVELVFNRVADATVVRVGASPTSQAGRWQAVVDLPEGGTWTVAAVVQGPNYAGTFALDTFQVSPATATAASSTSPATIVTPQQLVPWIVALVLAAGLLGAALLARRQTPTAQRG
jgi:hypothetical protein